MSLLALRNVGRRFGGLDAVSEVSMDVPAGSITGIIGPNGAGKTTLINLVTGILKLSEGQVLLDGVDISAEQPAQIARRGVARTFQTIRLLAEASVLDNVVAGFHRHERSSLLANLLGLPSARAELARFRGEAHALLDRFGMSHLAEQRAGDLSYGHQRRVEMMRALALKPRLVLLDEPVAGMNDVEALALGDIFRSMAKEGGAVLLIEHNMRFVMSICDRLYVLDNGRVIASGAPAAVANDPDVITAYLGEAEADLPDALEDAFHA